MSDSDSFEMNQLICRIGEEERLEGVTAADYFRLICGYLFASSHSSRVPGETSRTNESPGVGYHMDCITITLDAIPLT